MLRRGVPSAWDAHLSLRPVASSSLLGPLPYLSSPRRWSSSSVSSTTARGKQSVAHGVAHAKKYASSSGTSGLFAQMRDSWSLLPIMQLGGRGRSSLISSSFNVQYVPPDVPVAHAIIRMIIHRCDSLVVGVPGETFLGLVTERDILQSTPLELGASRRLCVEEVMTPRSKLFVGKPSASLEYAASAMRRGDLAELPLVRRHHDTGSEHVVAMVTAHELAGHLLDALRKGASARSPLVHELLLSNSTSSSFATQDRIDVVPAASSVADAVQLMKRTRASSLLVTSGNGGSGGDGVDVSSVRGTLSVRDVLQRLYVYDEARPEEVRVDAIMTDMDKSSVLPAHAPLADALAAMLRDDVSRMPVSHAAGGEMARGEEAGGEDEISMLSLSDVLAFCMEEHGRPKMATAPSHVDYREASLTHNRHGEPIGAADDICTGREDEAWHAAS